MKYPAYPKYKDSGVKWVDEIPAHWQVVGLRHLGQIRYGLGEPPKAAADGVPFVRATDIDKGLIDLNCVKRVEPDEVPWHRNPKLCENEILVVRSGAYTGDSAIVTPEVAGSVAGYDMVLRITNGVPKFIAWSLLSKPVLNGQIFTLRDRAAQPHLNAEELGSCVVAVPTHDEQRTIAAFLDRETARIDRLIAKKRELIELLGEKRQALISRCVTRGLPPDAAAKAGLDPHPKMKDSGIEWLGEVPEHWDVLSLRRKCEMITSSSRGWAKHYSDDGELFLRIANLTRSTIDLDLSSSQRVTVPDTTEGTRTRVRPGDLLFSVTAYLGSVAVVPDDIEPSYVSQHLALVRLRSETLSSRWAGYVALSKPGQCWFDQQAYGGTKIQLSLDDVASMPLLVPPEQEQHAVVEYLDNDFHRTSKLIKAAEKTIVALNEYRTALITAAVTGTIDVREAMS